MNSNPFKLFIKLVSFDQSLVALEEKKRDMHQAVSSIESAIDKIQQEIEAFKVRVHELKKDVDQKELEMQSLDEREQLLKKQTELLSSPREYKSLSNEISALKQRQEEYEDVLMKAWNSLETAQQECCSYVRSKQEEERALGVELEQKNAACVQISCDIEELSSQRPAKSAGIPEEWLHKYSAMRGVVSDPVVPVEHDACSACVFTVTPQDLAELRKNKLLQCRDCYRFLYINHSDDV